MRRCLLRSITARRFRDELTAALRWNDFVLHFQPVVELPTGRVAGAEALIRWNHVDRGLLAPSEFIPFAQEHDLLRPISAWVIDGALTAAGVLCAIEPSFRVWVNVSASELRRRNWLDRIASTGSVLEGLGVEITESAAITDLPEALGTLAAIKRAGIAIALDDFGTGHSSLAQLKQIPFDVVKLDRSFIAGFPGDAHDREIVVAMLSIGRTLGFETVAEGIETPEQAEALRDAGCRYGQGFHLGRPMLLENLVATVRLRRAIEIGRRRLCQTVPEQ